MPASPAEQGWGEQNIGCKASSTPAWKTSPVQAWEVHAGRVYLISAFILLEDAEKKPEDVQKELKELEKILRGRTGKVGLHNF